LFSYDASALGREGASGLLHSYSPQEAVVSDFGDDLGEGIIRGQQLLAAWIGKSAD
jgi:hypothetical protein